MAGHLYWNDWRDSSVKIDFNNELPSHFGEESDATFCNLDFTCASGLGTKREDEIQVIRSYIL